MPTGPWPGETVTGGNPNGLNDCDGETWDEEGAVAVRDTDTEVEPTSLRRGWYTRSREERGSRPSSLAQTRPDDSPPRQRAEEGAPWNSDRSGRPRDGCRDQNGQDWADIIDMLTMDRDERRKLVRLLGEIEASNTR